ncbi:MAG: M48 family metalloprotease [Candidatus Thioglobus sp.]|nr:M48 family metalloprotease [Candidatus Thioglobus sp.]
MKKIALLLICLNVFALEVPELTAIEPFSEKKLGNQFLQFIWQTDEVITDVEITTYLNKLGFELVNYSQNPRKHFGFFMLNDSSINAFAGPYGYIGVHSGAILVSKSESELAAVLSHEIAHITQNHLNRFSEKTSKHNYLLFAGLVLAALLDSGEATEAVAASTIAGVTQQGINFTREHEWEADRIGTKILIKSGFNPKGMADFFAKLKDSPNAIEFLRTHPLSVNRISESLPRAARLSSDYRQDSFAYKTIKAKLYYQKRGAIKPQKDLAITHYMNAYAAFEKQKYQLAKQQVDKLLSLNNDKSSNILAGRIAAAMGKIDKAQQYFDKNNLLEDDEPSIYYAAKAYENNGKIRQAIATLKPFLRGNPGTYQSHQLLGSLFVRQGALDRAHVQSAKALIIKGNLDGASKQYQRAKALTNSQDLADVLEVKIDDLQKILDRYEKY